MKKLLYVLGGIGLCGAAFLYFRKQLDLALSYDYEIDNYYIKALDDEHIEIEADIKLVNKSAFEVSVIEYDLSVFYANAEIGRAFSTESFVIKADSFSQVKATGSVVFNDAKKAVLPLITSMIKRNPIKISVQGYVKVRFMGVPYTLRFQKEEFEYSSDLLLEMGLDDDLEKLKDKLPFLRKI